jgi:hypothetical protein
MRDAAGVRYRNEELKVDQVKPHVGLLSPHGEEARLRRLEP